MTHNYRVTALAVRAVTPIYRKMIVNYTFQDQKYPPPLLERVLFTVKVITAAQIAFLINFGLFLSTTAG